MLDADVKAWHLRALQGLTTLAALEACASPKHNLSILCHSLNQEDYPLVMTNLAMENGPFIDALPIKH